MGLWRSDDGRWGVDWREGGRGTRRYRVLVGSRREAEAVLADHLLRKREGRFDVLRRPSPAPSFETVAARFLQEHAVTRRSPETFESAIRVLRRAFGTLTLDQITGSRIREWMQGRRAEGASNGTINRQRACLGSLLTFAMEVMGWVGPHPLHRGTLGRVKPLPEAPPRDRTLTADETTRLLAACESPFRELVTLALLTGLRRGELLSLRWADIRDNCVHLRAETTKTARSRVVPLAPAAIAALESLPRDSVRIFSWRDVRYQWERALKTAGITNFRFHDLRHQAASTFVHNGGDLYRLQRLLGHTTPAMTTRYANLSEEWLRESASYFE